MTRFPDGEKNEKKLMREGRTQTEGGHKNGEQNDGNELENDPGFSHVFDL
mgnify:CR=1 FL=1